jgi:hypothetical protein
MQSADPSNLDESINNTVQQWVAQVDQEIDLGPLEGRVHVSLHHLENLQPQTTTPNSASKTPNPST